MIGANPNRLFSVGRIFLQDFQISFLIEKVFLGECGSYIFQCNFSWEIIENTPNYSFLICMEYVFIRNINF